MVLVLCLAAGQGGLAASWCQGAGRTTDRTGGDLALPSGHSEVKFISIWNAASVEILVAQITKQKGLSVFLTISDSYHLLYLFGYSMLFTLFHFANHFRYHSFHSFLPWLPIRRSSKSPSV